jgi:hypothetical protein
MIRPTAQMVQYEVRSASCRDGGSADEVIADHRHRRWSAAVTNDPMADTAVRDGRRRAAGDDPAKLDLVDIDRRAARAGGDRGVADITTHVVRTAASITGDGDIVIIGSQTILGVADVDGLPEEATMSMEADLAFRDDVDASKAGAVDGAIGELSQSHETYGYYA